MNKTTSSVEPDWFINLDVNATTEEGTISDITNYAGVASDASGERDQYDAPEPPTLGGISAWFDCPDVYTGVLTRDIRPESAKIDYIFKVKSVNEADVTVHWDSSLVPEKYGKIILEDTGAQGGSQFVDMRAENEYEYHSDATEIRVFNITLITTPTITATLQGGDRPYPAGYNGVKLAIKLYDDETELDYSNILTEECLYEYTTDNGDIEIIDIDQQTKTITLAVNWDCEDDVYNVTLWDTHISPWDHTLINLMNDVDLFSLETLDMEELQEGNADGSVQIAGGDFSLLLNDYGSYPGHANWNTGRCDFDHTNQVDSTDASLLFGNYNEYSPIIVGGEKAGGEQETFGKVDMSLKAEDAAKSLSESKTFFITVEVNAGEQKVDAIDTFLTFDPACLEVASVTPGKVLGVTMLNTFDNNKGTIALCLGRDMQSEAESENGMFTLGTIEFKPKKEIKETSIRFETSYPRKTNVAYHGQSLLGTVSDLELGIVP